MSLLILSLHSEFSKQRSRGANLGPLGYGSAGCGGESSDSPAWVRARKIIHCMAQETNIVNPASFYSSVRESEKRAFFLP
jgi:hypothetical protein